MSAVSKAASSANAPSEGEGEKGKGKGKGKKSKGKTKAAAGKGGDGGGGGGGGKTSFGELRCPSLPPCALGVGVSVPACEARQRAALPCGRRRCVGGARGRGAAPSSPLFSLEWPRAQLTPRPPSPAPAPPNQKR